MQYGEQPPFWQVGKHVEFRIDQCASFEAIV